MVNLGCTYFNKPKRLAELPVPAETVAFVDSTQFSSCGGMRAIWASMVWPDCCPRDKPSARQGKYTRHQKGENLIFADGHAKWMHGAQIAQNCRALFDPSGRDRRSFWQVHGITPTGNEFN